MQIKKVTVNNAQESAMTWSDPDTCISRTMLEKKTALEGKKNQRRFIAISIISQEQFLFGHLIIFQHLKHLQNT